MTCWAFLVLTSRQDSLVVRVPIVAMQAIGLAEMSHWPPQCVYLTPSLASDGHYPLRIRFRQIQEDSAGIAEGEFRRHRLVLLAIVLARIEPSCSWRGCQLFIKKAWAWLKILALNPSWGTARRVEPPMMTWEAVQAAQRQSQYQMAYGTCSTSATRQVMWAETAHRDYQRH